MTCRQLAQIQALPAASPALRRIEDIMLFYPALDAVNAAPDIELLVDVDSR